MKCKIIFPMLSPYHPKIKQLKQELQTMFDEKLIWAFVSFMMGILLYFYHFNPLWAMIGLALSVGAMILFRQKNLIYFLTHLFSGTLLRIPFHSCSSRICTGLQHIQPEKKALLLQSPAIRLPALRQTSKRLH